MNTPHTPAPWYGKETSSEQGLIISETTGATVAVAYDARDTSLLAAAPELLSTLERLTEKVDRANAIQHSGGEILPEDWAELYGLIRDSRQAIETARRQA